MAPYILFGLLIAGILHAFISPDLMGRHLARPGWKSVLKASILGIPLPLCSCGVLPAAISMRRSGASKSATSAFLISTPQTGVDSIAATWSLLDPAFAIIRPVAALTTAFFGGVAVSLSEKDAVTDHNPIINESPLPLAEPSKPSLIHRLLEALHYGFFDMMQSIGGWLLGGLVIAALITEFVPTDFFASLASHPLLAMLAVVIVAVPMYVCATGSIPIALSLIMKGLSPGTALVLLMAGPAANFASVTLLSRELGRKATAIYVGSIVVGAILFGLLFDFLSPSLPLLSHVTDCCHDAVKTPGLFPAICGVTLIVLLIVALISRFYYKPKITSDMTKEYLIKGMNCPHCRMSVEKAIAAVEGVKSVTVNLSTGIATVDGTQTDEAIAAAVSAAGFDVVTA